MVFRTNDYKTNATVCFQTVAVSNPRHRRSRSAGVLWVDHQPGPSEPPLVIKSTIMQPSVKGRDVLTTHGCPDEKTLKSPKASRYSLTTQTQDIEGELQTKIYKVSLMCLSDCF